MGFSIARYERAALDELIDAAQASPADESPAMNEIVRRFEPLAKRIAGRYAKQYDDVANAARIALVIAVRRHDRSRSGFPAYAEKFMRGAAAREYRRWVALGAREVSLEDVPLRDLQCTSGAKPDALGNEWGDDRVGQLLPKLTARQQRLMHRRYLDDAALRDIAAEDGCSVSAVSQRLATVHRQFRAAAAA